MGPILKAESVVGPKMSKDPGPNHRFDGIILGNSNLVTYKYFYF